MLRASATPLLGICSVVLASVGSSSAALATELTLYGGYRTADELKDEASGQSIDLDEGGSVGIVLSVPRDDKTELEFLYSTQSTHFSGSGTSVDGVSIDIDYWHLGGTYLFPRQGATPFISGSLGATHFAPDGLSSETKFSLSLGGGAKVPLGKRLALRFEARAFMTALNSDGAMFCTNGQCRVAASGSLFTQVEALAGLTFKF
jgi:hypothetical protein